MLKWGNFGPKRLLERQVEISLSTAGVIDLTSVMKPFAAALLAIILPSAAFAKGEVLPRFEHVSEFLAWADKKLDADDYDGLVSAQADTTDTRQTKLASVKKLDGDLGSKKLITIFEGRTFPKDATTFKLGGHMRELGHCHIDFVKEGGSWHLTRIWQCR